MPWDRVCLTVIDLFVRGNCRNMANGLLLVAGDFECDNEG